MTRFWLVPVVVWYLWGQQTTMNVTGSSASVCHDEGGKDLRRNGEGVLVKAESGDILRQDLNKHRRWLSQTTHGPRGSAEQQLPLPPHTKRRSRLYLLRKAGHLGSTEHQTEFKESQLFVSSFLPSSYVQTLVQKYIFAELYTVW